MCISFADFFDFEEELNNAIDVDEFFLSEHSNTVRESRLVSTYIYLSFLLLIIMLPFRRKEINNISDTVKLKKNILGGLFFKDEGEKLVEQIRSRKSFKK